MIVVVVVETVIVGSRRTTTFSGDRTRNGYVFFGTTVGTGG